ncbi:MAG: G5 domain-containing protein [Patescibacteria group bacterium]|nr:G5 domain-containing protein [Patescibacteria group bacterium]
MAPAIFFLVFLTVLLNSNSVFGEGLVASVETPVTIKYDGKTKNLVVTQNTIGGAIEQARLSLGQFDITDPPSGTLLTGQKQSITIVRALPVLISDNNQEHLAYSAYTNENDILKQLNIVIYPEDRVSSNLIMDPADENAAGQKVSIERAPVYKIKVDGGEQIIRSWGKTIGEVLNGKVSLGKLDIVEPGVSSSSYEVQAISITRINVAEVNETVTIPFTTEARKDYNLYKGQTRVLNEGENGQKQQTIRITYQNGIEISRVVLSSETTKAAINEVISQGVKPYNAGMWWDTLVKAAAIWGIDPVGMYNVMICESNGNPYSGGYYKGLYQYNPDTWSGASNAYPGGGFRGALITDGTAQIYVTAWKVSTSGWGAWGCKP